LGHWLAGFADGEGCFTTRRSRKGFVCEFVIHLRADDAAILKAVQKATEIGDIVPAERNDGSAPMVKWIVRRQADCAKLVQLFETFPLRAKKARDFSIWASAVREWIRHKPGTSWDDLRSHAEMISAVKLYGSSFNPSQFFHYRWARLAFDLLKPGGHIFAFGGTRTYHRLAAAIEDAGFIIRDQFAWAYGSGFPKSHDIAKALDKAQLGIHRGRAGRVGHSFGQEYERTPKGDPISAEAQQWEGWGTAVKPAWEPICLAQKPVEGTIAGNVLKHGVGGLNIDACRIGDFQNTTPPGTDRYNKANYEKGYRPSAYGREGEASADRRYDDRGSTNFAPLPGPRGGSSAGRFPANIAHDGSAEVLACFPDSEGQQGDVRGTEPSSVTVDIYGKFAGRVASAARNDSGSAARFFYTAKADESDRWGSKHPTVKPIDLLRYYARLITPPGGTVLDPFAGSGTLGVAAMAEGFNAILIEREDEYIADIRERIAFYEGEGRHSLASKNRNALPPKAGDNPLIDWIDSQSEAAE
jgi:site-specific DNA-methyltransferase (adenine-specific)